MNYELIIKNAKQLLKNSDDFVEILGNTVKINDTAYPLTPWRYDRKLFEMKNLAINQKALRDICSYKSQRIDTAEKDIYDLLYEEIDACEWILSDKIISVFADINSDKYITVILKTKCGILCNIDISVTLPVGTKPITKHEIIGKEGMISDRAINEQLPVEAIYLFSKEKNDSFTDNDLYMLGLTPNEVMVADNIIFLAKNKPDTELFSQTKARNTYIVNCVKNSAANGDVVVVEENII